MEEKIHLYLPLVGKRSDELLLGISFIRPLFGIFHLTIAGSNGHTLATDVNR